MTELFVIILGSFVFAFVFMAVIAPVMVHYSNRIAR